MTKTEQQLAAAKEAARKTGLITDAQSAQILNEIADALVANKDAIIAANAQDLSRMDSANPMYDRLSIDSKRIDGMAVDTRNVATLPVPYGEIIEQRTMPNGLDLRKVRVPLGVVGVIYEARPNVTVDVVSLCLRSGNAVVLKGGSDAKDSNTVLVDLIHNVLKNNNIDPDIIQLLPPEREAATQLMNAVGYIDVLIPRGSKGLINAVRDNAKVPVIETGAGVVHTYFDKAANLDMGRSVVTNAKTRRVSVCNALDCLIIHS
ncbi:MAG: glutamate-5-semialdehyde dehydrogenase, partial [Bacteroidales bacterium]|nr:glutamate-5-semialdehyde dehydrogenase [Bacteroidales bacterium]